MKIVQNVLFRQFGGRCGQIAFSTFLDQKIALPDWNSRQYVKKVGFPWKLYKTCFSGHAEDVLAKSHFQRFRSKNRSTGLKFTPIRKNSRLSMKIVQNVLLRQYEGRFSQNFLFSTFLNPKKRFTRLKFTPIREKCRLCIKIVENVLLRRSGGRFGQITFFNVLDPKIALPDWNSRQYVKTVGFPVLAWISIR